MEALGPTRAGLLSAELGLAARPHQARRRAQQRAGRLALDPDIRRAGLAVAGGPVRPLLGGQRAEHVQARGPARGQLRREQAGERRDDSSTNSVPTGIDEHVARARQREVVTSIAPTTPITRPEDAADQAVISDS